MAREKELITLEEAKEALKINKDELDEVCLYHAGLYDEVAERHVRAVSERDFAKDELANVHAEVARGVRLDYAEKGEKVTEKAVEAETLADKKYAKANEAYLESKLNADLWGNRKDSFLQRSSMIKRLCEMNLSGYYTSRTVEGVAEAGKEITHGADRDAMGKSRRARKRRD